MIGKGARLSGHTVPSRTEEGVTAAPPLGPASYPTERAWAREGPHMLPEDGSFYSIDGVILFCFSFSVSVCSVI